ncbi:MAG: MFS transporter [Pseudomonadota bacterium]
MKPGEPDPVGGRYARYALIVLIVVYVFNFIDRQILSILAEEIKADLGITDSEIGFLYGTAFAVFYAVFGIPLGRLADVWVRRTLIAGGLAFWSLMTALSGTARSFFSLAIYRFGVGIGEASATPASFSMLSDLFPPQYRATVLSIYSGGIYIGAGIGLFLGGVVVDGWKAMYPADTAPLGLEAWQVAFFVVGLPGLLLALWVLSLREPQRGLSEGLEVPAHPAPFSAAWASLCSVLPPLTIYSLWRNDGPTAVLWNLLVAAGIALVAWLLNRLVPAPLQWIALGVGVYAAASWVQGQRRLDPVAYTLMFGSRAFLCATIGFPVISFMTYGIGFWTPPYIVRHFGVSLAEAGTLLGLTAAVGGWLGITAGGIWADRWKRTNPNARLYIGALVPVLTVPVIVLFLYTDSTAVAYSLNFVLSVFSTLWIGAAASTVTDLVLPQQRATASAYYVLMNTFVGLALGPFVIGQLSDGYAASGMAADVALRAGMLTSLVVLVVAVLALLVASRYLAQDEASRLDRAAAVTTD